MAEHINLTGVVGTIPKHIRTTEGLAVTSFRLASTVRRYDRGQNRWVDGDTNWFTVTAFRQLAVNVLESVDRGQPVMVTGRVRIKEWENGEKRGTSVEVVADSVGHDLSWGRASFERIKVSAPSEPGSPGPAESGSDSVTGPGGAAPGSGDGGQRATSERDASGWAMPGPGTGAPAEVLRDSAAGEPGASHSAAAYETDEDPPF